MRLFVNIFSIEIFSLHLLCLRACLAALAALCLVRFPNPLYDVSWRIWLLYTHPGLWLTDLLAHCRTRCCASCLCILLYCTDQPIQPNPTKPFFARFCWFCNFCDVLLQGSWLNLKLAAHKQITFLAFLATHHTVVYHSQKLQKMHEIGKFAILHIAQREISIVLDIICIILYETAQQLMNLCITWLCIIAHNLQMLHTICIIPTICRWVFEKLA